MSETKDNDEISITDIVEALENNLTDTDTNTNTNPNPPEPVPPPSNQNPNSSPLPNQPPSKLQENVKKPKKRKAKEKDQDQQQEPAKTDEKPKKKKKVKDKPQPQAQPDQQPQNDQTQTHSKAPTNQDNKPPKRKKNAEPSETKTKIKTQHIPTQNTNVHPSSSSSDPKDIVFNYMLTQNRPYSVINIFDNLHGQVKKAQLIKVLDALTDEKKLICKEYNTKIYLANQNNFPPINADALASVDASIEMYKKENAKLKEMLNDKQAELKSIVATYTDSELNCAIEKKRKELETLKCKVDKINNNVIEPVPEEKMAEKEKEVNNMKVKYKKIKRICSDIIDKFAEGMDIKRNKFMEDAGIEDDKDIIKKYNIII